MHIKEKMSNLIYDGLDNQLTTLEKDNQFVKISELWKQ